MNATPRLASHGQGACGQVPRNMRTCIHGLITYIRAPERARDHGASPVWIAGCEHASTRQAAATRATLGQHCGAGRAWPHPTRRRYRVYLTIARAAAQGVLDRVQHNVGRTKEALRLAAKARRR